MKLWKRWTAAVLAAAMALLLLAACGPSGPSAPDAPDTPGSSETGKDPTDEKTEEQKAAAVVDTLNTVRKNYGNNTPLELNEQACAFAKEMAQVQLDGVNGKYGKNPSTNRDYTAACANVRKKMVGEKKGSIGVGALQGAYPDANQFEKWANKKWKDETEKASVERNNALVKKEATLVGVGVVHNTDPATMENCRFMVVVMTY
ncbi:hypothetical protein [Faecalibacterium prausnitzii]|jgi:predicted small lipoprotein YifL|uniref:SCP domain-containing protein n=1 Tax=Faecalibacterium prausnitzii TaxID=853 RepID=A0A173U0Y6_9FIRM|nr:hypothetical protein [Faecalibacterium prausnitzii]CUN07148.1 Uncharacterised protein [Faecalibacterium prausnitzii]